jgi:hypothetical protein
MRIDWPESFANPSNPSAANGSVSARNVSGAISVTPSFNIGQLQPHTSASTATGTSFAAVMCGVADTSARDGFFTRSRYVQAGSRSRVGFIRVPAAAALRRTCSDAARAPA